MRRTHLAIAAATLLWGGAVLTALLPAGGSRLTAAGARPAAADARATAAAPGATATRPDGEALIYTITLDDAVHPITARYVKESIDRAGRDGAALLILRLDTPGGVMTSMEEIITAITHSRAPVVVYVHGTQAASAGFFITIAADVAVMAPGTRIGAAHPVAAMGEIPKDSVLMAKVENDAAAYIRTLATNRGRDAGAAEKAVRESSAFTEQEALKLHLIDLVARDEVEILRALDGRAVRRFSGDTETLHLERTRIVAIEMSGRERFLSMLANPALAALLLFAGLALLYIEFTHPGLIAPGLLGGVCVLLFMMSTQILPISWVGVAFVALGLGMFVLEIKVVSHGALTAGGIACLVIGSMLLFREMPGLPGVRVARAAILSIALTAALLMALLTWLVTRVHGRASVSGASGLLLDEGTALTRVDPAEGRVFVHGESWNARAARAVPEGARVRVMKVRNLLLEVEEIR